MPVNPLPILIPLILVWGAITYFLFRWRRLAGSAFVGLSLLSLVALFKHTNVERRFDEDMRYSLVEIGDYRTVEITTSRGNTVSAGSPELVARLRVRTNGMVRVVMRGWYNFGRLRAFEVESIDGVHL